MQSKLQSPLYHTLTTAITYHLLERNKLNGANYYMLRNSYNVSILLCLNSIIEGYFNDILYDSIENLDKSINYKNENFENINDFTLYASLFGETGKRIKEKLLKELDSSKWQSKQNIFKLLYGKNIKQVLGSSLYNSFNIQMQLRNLISHGQTLALHMESKDDEISNLKMKRYEGKYEGVYQYIKKRYKDNILDPTQNIMLIFSNQVVDDFLNDSIEIFKSLNDVLNPMEIEIRHKFFLKNFEGIKKQLHLTQDDQGMAPTSPLPIS